MERSDTVRTGTLSSAAGVTFSRRLDPDSKLRLSGGLKDSMITPVRGCSWIPISHLARDWPGRMLLRSRVWVGFFFHLQWKEDPVPAQESFWEFNEIQ